MRTPARLSERMAAACRDQGGLNRNEQEEATRRTLNRNEQDIATRRTLAHQNDLGGVTRMNLSFENNLGGATRDPLGSSIIDLTLNPTQESVTNTPGTLDNVSSNRVLGAVLFLDTEFDKDLAGPLPRSNTNSSRTSALSARSGPSDQADLLSARSSNSTEQSVTWDNSSNHMSNKFGITKITSDDRDFKAMCRKKIGNGTYVCLKRDCIINHRGGGELADIQKGEIMLQKSPDIAFLEPTTLNVHVAEAVLIKWASSKKPPLEEWSTLFAWLTDIDQGAIFASLARNHKSPRMLSACRFEVETNTFRNLLEVINDKDSDHYFVKSKKRTMSEDELGTDPNKARRRSFSEELALGSEGEKMALLKLAVKRIFKLLEALMERLDQKDELITEEVQMSFSRIEMVQTDIGTRSTSRTDRLEVPTIWGSVALLACTIEELERLGNWNTPALPEWKTLLMKEMIALRSQL